MADTGYSYMDSGGGWSFCVKQNYDWVINQTKSFVSILLVSVGNQWE